MAGPLDGLRVVEMAGIGPGPFTGMLLADMGAEVVRVERPGAMVWGPPETMVTHRGRRFATVDLKRPEGVDTVLRLVDRADALVEGFRPGVMERLGLGPDVCLERNPRLVYGRITGWGQDGPMAARAGHDIDYIALGGVLNSFRRPGERPLPPVNLIGDFGGGGMLLAVGILGALVEAGRSGHGQVVDAAMVDGSALLMAMLWGMRAGGSYDDTRPGTNLLDTGAPFYDVYECADGRFVAVGALEPQFYAALMSGLGLTGEDVPAQYELDRWPELAARIREAFLAQPRDHWAEVFAPTDACVSPVLDFDEARAHPHNAARATFTDPAGLPQPAPAPRFSRTPSAISGPPGPADRDTDAVLLDWGISEGEVAGLREAGVTR